MVAPVVIHKRKLFTRQGQSRELSSNQDLVTTHRPNVSHQIFNHCCRGSYQLSQIRLSRDSGSRTYNPRSKLLQVFAWWLFDVICFCSTSSCRYSFLLVSYILVRSLLQLPLEIHQWRECSLLSFPILASNFVFDTRSIWYPKNNPVY